MRQGPMSIVSPAAATPDPSALPLAPAARIARGVRRALWQQGATSLLEVSLKNGRRADVLALDRAGEVLIVEIKSSVTDFRTDHKWQEYRAFCDRFCFAVAEGFPLDLIPADCGLMVADAFGAALVREPPLHRLHPSRRKALILDLALMTAARLHRLEDPWLGG